MITITTAALFAFSAIMGLGCVALWIKVVAAHRRVSTALRALNGDLGPVQKGDNHVVVRVATQSHHGGLPGALLVLPHDKVRLWANESVMFESPLGGISFGRLMFTLTDKQQITLTKENVV